MAIFSKCSKVVTVTNIAAVEDPLVQAKHAAVITQVRARVPHRAFGLYGS